MEAKRRGLNPRIPIYRPFSEWLPEITPRWTWSWRHQRYLYKFLDGVSNGTIKKLMIFMPPRHGKSEMVTIRYPVWRLEQDPSINIIVGAYSHALAAKFSRKARAIAMERIAIAWDRKAANDWETTAGGGMFAVGVGSGVTGRGADLIMIDDPVKSREEANSLTYREKVWDWWTDDLSTRLHPDGAVILTMTRWHHDDMAGRILASEEGPEWTVCSLPALAEEDDPLGRKVGEALCPERYDEAALAEIQRRLLRSFLALYQQRPTPREGDMFKREWFYPVPAAPAGCKLIRYWDKGGTEGGGAYTAGVLVGEKDGIYYIIDVVRGQWSAHNREQQILNTAIRDGEQYGKYNFTVMVEQEPGSGGKESAENTVKNLAGFKIKVERPTGDKATRAEPFADQAEGGNVRMVIGSWNQAYIDEAVAFPFGAYKDQIDGTSGAFNNLSKKRESRIY